MASVVPCQNYQKPLR